MKKCRACRSEESDATAYMLDKSTMTGLCRDCADKLEEEDLDRMTLACMDKLCHVVNGGNATDLAASMFRAIQRQHRYLQNEFFLALHKMFEQYGALPENRYDQRNEWAVRAAGNWEKHSFDKDSLDK